MSNLVRVTIDLGGRYLSQQQQIFGRIIEDRGDCIMFRDLENEETVPPHRIAKRKITNIEPVDDKPLQNTSIVKGSRG